QTAVDREVAKRIDRGYDPLAVGPRSVQFSKRTIFYRWQLYLTNATGFTNPRTMMLIGLASIRYSHPAIPLEIVRVSRITSGELFRVEVAGAKGLQRTRMSSPT